MMNDPGQEVNINKKNPKQYEQLKKAYSEWFSDVSRDWELEAIIPCGYTEFPISKLSVVEANFTGDFRFHGSGYVNDWLENWVNPNDSITWDVNLVSSGQYKFMIEYQCTQDELGSQIVLSVGGKTLKSTIEKVFDEPLYPSHDRARRAGELQKPWGKIELGALELKKGQTQVILKSNMMKGSQVMEVKSVIVEKMK